MGRKASSKSPDWLFQLSPAFFILLLPSFLLNVPPLPRWEKAPCAPTPTGCHGGAGGGWPLYWLRPSSIQCHKNQADRGQGLGPFLGFPSLTSALLALEPSGLCFDLGCGHLSRRCVSPTSFKYWQTYRFRGPLWRGFGFSCP